MAEKNVNVDEVNKLVADIGSSCAAFLADAQKPTVRAAARRARKMSLELTKLFKTYRSISLK